jgi:hypothetical protein
VTICFLAAGLSVIGLMGCSHETGPALSAVLEGARLSPTLDPQTEPDAFQRCCCRVIGNVRNTSTIEVHASLRFRVTDVGGKDVGTAIDFVPNIPPGDSRTFNAAGIYISCSSVRTYEPDLLVIGLYHDDTGGQ